MKKGIALLVLMALATLALGAGQPPGVTGGVQWGGGGERYWAVFSVQQIGDGPQAKGFYWWWNRGERGYTSIRADIDCIKFLDDGVVEFSGRTVRSQNLPVSGCGTYFKLRATDGGTPASAGDKLAFFMSPCAASGDMRAGFDYDPCTPGTFQGYIVEFPMQGGNLVVRNP